MAIHKFQDIGRHVPLYDGLCEKTCGIDTTTEETPYPGRSCSQVAGTVTYADLGVQDNLNKHLIAKPSFESYGTGTKNVVARYPGLTQGKPDVWYNVKITRKPNNQNGLFNVEFDNAMACARRQSGKYLKQEQLQIADVSTALNAALGLARM